MARFEIWISENGWSRLDYFNLIDTVECTGACEYQLTSLQPDTRYWVMIREVQGTSNEIKGAFSTPIEFRTLYVPPNGFNILLSTDGITYELKDSVYDTFNYTLENLTPGQTYYSKIEIVGFNEFSNIVEFTLPMDYEESLEYTNCDRILTSSFLRDITIREGIPTNSTSVSFKARTNTRRQKFFMEVLE